MSIKQSGQTHEQKQAIKSQAVPHGSENLTTLDLWTNSLKVDHAIGLDSLAIQVLNLNMCGVALNILIALNKSSHKICFLPTSSKPNYLFSLLSETCHNIPHPVPHPKIACRFLIQCHLLKTGPHEYEWMKDIPGLPNIFSPLFHLSIISSPLLHLSPFHPLLSGRRICRVPNSQQVTNAASVDMNII